MKEPPSLASPTLPTSLPHISTKLTPVKAKGDHHGKTH